MRLLRWSAAAAALALSACGGGGGGGSTATPTPTPPVATPSPTPTPAPAPVFTYAAFDPAQDRLFAGQVAAASTLQRYVSDVAPFYAIESQEAALEANRSRLEFAYGAGRTATIRFGGEATVFAPADVTTDTADGIVWRRARSATARGDALTFARFANAQYVYSAVQEISEDARTANTAAAFRDTTRFLLVGERTRDGDLPTTGTSTYAVTLGTTVVARNRGGGFGATGTLAVDHATGVVSARLAASQTSFVTGTTPEAATLVLTGTASASGIAGTISSPDSGYTGSFSGDLFGPRGAETGIVLVLTRPDGVRAAGRIIGRR